MPNKWRSLGTGLVAGITMSVICSACLGGPEGSPGLDRVHLLEKDALYTDPLPDGYKVLSTSVGVPKWDSNGYPFGDPGWDPDGGVTETFRTSASEAAVVAYFERRAVQTGWAVDAKATYPTLGSWGWTKRFRGFTAGAGISAGEHGKWILGLEAPPIGPTA